eukprot:TRINITY_DN4451_c0_g1_i1.p1 TRINITY_DN4451_c0_g1~~TRINITY_DN4451_c0_g1_i1.p1  ORF type:complete len:970 (-),score=216.91 TRINITY_DN4451_c0_g1_i1:77-2818(-)
MVGAVREAAAKGLVAPNDDGDTTPEDSDESPPTAQRQPELVRRTTYYADEPDHHDENDDVWLHQIAAAAKRAGMPSPRLSPHPAPAGGRRNSSAEALSKAPHTSRARRSDDHQPRRRASAELASPSTMQGVNLPQPPATAPAHLRTARARDRRRSRLVPPITLPKRMGLPSSEAAHVNTVDAAAPHTQAFLLPVVITPPDGPAHLQAPQQQPPPSTGTDSVRPPAEVTQLVRSDDENTPRKTPVEPPLEGASDANQEQAPPSDTCDTCDTDSDDSNIDDVEGICGGAMSTTRSNMSEYRQELYEEGEYATNALRFELSKFKQRSNLHIKRLNCWRNFRFKTTGCMLFVAVLGLALMLSLVFSVFLTSARNVEEKAQKREMEQAISVMRSSLGTLRQMAAVWACSDEAVAWLERGDPTGYYWQTHFAIDRNVFFNSTAILFVTLEAKAFAYQHAGAVLSPFPVNVLDTVSAQAVRQYAGLVSDANNTFLYEMVSLPLLTTSCTGDPAGFFVVLREPRIDVNYTVTLCPLCISAFAAAEVPQSLEKQSRSLGKSGKLVQLLPTTFTFQGEEVALQLGVSRDGASSCSEQWGGRTHNLVSTAVMVADQDNRPSMFLIAYGKRYLRSFSAANLSTEAVALVALCLVFIVFSLLFMEFCVLHRITKLVHSVKKITSNKNFARRLHVHTHDELQLMAEAVNFMLDEVQSEQRKTDLILYNTFPKDVVQRLKDGSEISDFFPDTTVLLADLCNFTEWSSTKSPIKVVQVLNHVFSAIDIATSREGVTKVKTIGDAYLAVSGVPRRDPDHASHIISLALLIVKIVRQVGKLEKEPLDVRIGVHSGPISAGVLGLHRFIWDVWGDTVNTASRLQVGARPGTVHCSARTFELARNDFSFDGPHKEQLKGLGEQPTYFVLHKRR